MTFRGYEAGDLEAMFRLDEVCFDPRFRFSRRAMRRFAEAGNAHVVVAEGEGELAGFSIVHVEELQAERVGYVVTLDVAPELRRQGIAGALVRQAEVQAAQAGCAAMMLHVFTGNAAAVRFYQRCGYSLAGYSEGFYGVSLEGGKLDALVYRKELSAKF